MTLFVAGHSYADGAFSTATTLVDMSSGETAANLEQFTVLRDGVPISAPDYNFWGVTFAPDGNRFYATLGSAGKTYLLEGDLAARQMKVLREGVECPSLSPDGTRLAFKQLISSTDTRMWHLAVMDLATLEDHPLAVETRSVDDQVEWLDDGHVLYALPDEGPPGDAGDARVGRAGRWVGAAAHLPSLRFVTFGRSLKPAIDRPSSNSLASVS